MGRKEGNTEEQCCWGTWTELKTLTIPINLVLICGCSSLSMSKCVHGAEIKMSLNSEKKKVYSFKNPFLSSTQYNCPLFSSYISIIFFYRYTYHSFPCAVLWSFGKYTSGSQNWEVLNFSCWFFHCVLFSISFSLVYWAYSEQNWG